MACHCECVCEMGGVLELTLIACTAAAKSESGVSARKLNECAPMTTSCHKR